MVARWCRYRPPTGAAARAERDAVLGRAEAPLGSYGAESAALSVASDQPIPIEGDCGIGGEPYVPTAEEIATANADTDALAAVLDTYGVAYERIVDDLGFAYIETDYSDVVAQSVVDSFWADRYPPEPIDPAELDRIRAENDRIAAALDAVGVAYTRQSDDSGWEWLEWDYENPAAQEAVDAVYAELYPPVPPTRRGAGDDPGRERPGRDSVRRRRHRLHTDGRRGRLGMDRVGLRGSGGERRCPEGLRGALSAGAVARARRL